jgi:hypothetical protein
MRKIYLVLVLAASSLFSGCDTAQQILSGMNTTGLTNYEIVSGLKEALSVGTERSANQLSSTDGFFKNAVIKILLPKEAEKMESTLRGVGLGSLVDKAVLSMNRAAEEAAKEATPIFVNAVKQMTITDALGILKGGDFAATNYFKAKTTEALASSFKPVIDRAMSKVDATKYWTEVTTVYNTFSNDKINTDLTMFVTEKAIEGMFYQVGLEEQRIRQNPVARTTEILKKVFGSAAAQN